MATQVHLPRSAAAAGYKISAFFQSLILLLLNSIYQAITLLTSSGRTSSLTTSPTTQSGGFTRPSLGKMSVPAQPLSKPQQHRVVPALPLLPPRLAANKENTFPRTESESKVRPATPHADSEAAVVERLALLDLSRHAAIEAGAAGAVFDTRSDAAIHNGFMREALDMARLALRTNETPVGCVLVHRGQVIAKGMNATNVTRNGTRHAELMALSALLSYSHVSGLAGKSANKSRKQPLTETTNNAASTTGPYRHQAPQNGHLYPYGQKLHPSSRVDRSIVSESVLYVTVEPCVMCASLLRQLGIQKVYFGAVNDKFGGTGGVFHIHVNSTSPLAVETAPSSPTCRIRMTKSPFNRRAASSTGIVEGQSIVETPSSAMKHDIRAAEESLVEGDGGNVERGYAAEGGWGRDEAVTLLRQFYVQENGRAPQPRKKEGRAARLAAMMERDGHAGGPMSEAPPVTIPMEQVADLS